MQANFSSTLCLLVRSPGTSIDKCRSLTICDALDATTRQNATEQLEAAARDSYVRIVVHSLLLRKFPNDITASPAT